MKTRGRVMLISRLRCNKCGQIFPIPRRENQQRKIGHIKKLYCFRCQKRTKHTELGRN